MVSKNDLVIGILVLITGIVIYSFAPGGVLFQPMPGHTTTHYVGGSLAIVSGLIGLALYKKINRVSAAVSVLSIILGIVFILDAAPSGVLYSTLQPHGAAMQAQGGLTALVGIVGIAGSALVKKK